MTKNLKNICVSCWSSCISLTLISSTENDLCKLFCDIFLEKYFCFFLPVKSAKYICDRLSRISGCPSFHIPHIIITYLEATQKTDELLRNCYFSGRLQKLFVNTCNTLINLEYVLRDSMFAAQWPGLVRTDIQASFRY